MARNKYPEETVQLILDTAQRLFLEKGYDNTTIQDIVDQLGGLTKGAVYHHFKSKEAILSAVSDRLFYQNNPFDVVKDRTDLNGLQKLRAVARAHQSDTDSTNLTIQQLSIAPNPELLVDMIVGSMGSRLIGTEGSTFSTMMGMMGDPVYMSVSKYGSQCERRGLYLPK